MDNFQEFSSDTTNTIVPKKIRFHVYNDAKLMVGAGEEFLSACLESLKAAIDHAKIIAEIILVDNASTDTSPEIFTSFCQK